jgi:hypothetical protein
MFPRKKFPFKENVMHTPGPWIVDENSDPQEISIDAPNGDPTIGHGEWKSLVVVYGSDDFPEEGAEVARSNARLISAAPELFEALNNMVEIARIDEWDKALTGRHLVFRDALEALRKATNTSHADE